MRNILIRITLYTMGLTIALVAGIRFGTDLYVKALEHRHANVDSFFDGFVVVLVLAALLLMVIFFVEMTIWSVRIHDGKWIVSAPNDGK